MVEWVIAGELFFLIVLVAEISRHIKETWSGIHSANSQLFTIHKSLDDLARRGQP